MKHEHIDQVVQFRKVADGRLPEPAPLPWYAPARLIAFARRRPWSMAVVVLPTLLATLYYGLIASDLYVSEAHFLVRSAAQQQGVTSLGSLLQSVGVSRSTDDTFSVHDYIESRDIVAELARNANLGAILSRPEGDFIRRYPPFWGRHTFEQFYETYKTFVDVDFDTSTGISTLTVEAFRPEDSNYLARAILKASEGLINRMNDRSHRDTVEKAQADVTRAEQRASAVQIALTQYRIRTKDLDPRAAATSSYSMIGQLSLQLATAQSQLHQMQTDSPTSPQIEPLRNSINAMQAQIDRENGKVTGGANSMAAQLSEYEKLLLEQDFAAKGLASATLSLETARQTSERQQLYLEEIVTPQQADYPIYPRRMVNILLVLIVSLLLYGIGWLVSASVREHTGR